MNPNVWNIKEILSIPARSRNASSSGYSSSTDSQFMLGSQETIFCRNSQPSQQSSEGSDPKFLNNYHTKPLLFGIDGKDLHSRAVGALDKFEEDKRRAKEKRESDFLAKERLHLRETLNHIQHAVNDTEKNTAACKTVLEGFDSFATALQKNHNSITQQFEKMLSQMSSQKQLLTEIEENVLKTGVASTELGSRVKGLERNMEVLTHEHRREQNMLEEAVTLLNTLVSRHSTKPIPVRVTDSAIQTSPGLTVNKIQTSPGLTVNKIQTSPGLTVNKIQTSPGLTVNKIQTSPGLTVNKIQTSPGLTVNKIQTSPGLTVSMIQTSPGLTVNKIQTSPGLTVSVIQTSPGLTVKKIQTSPGLTVSMIQTSPGLTVNKIQTSPGLTVNKIQTSPGLTDSMSQTSPELSQTLFNQEQKCLPEDKRLPRCQIENRQSEVPSQNQGRRNQGKRLNQGKRRPLMPPKRKGTILYENSQSQTSTYNINPQGVSLPHAPKSLDRIKPDRQSKSVVGLGPEPRSKRLINIKPDRQLNSLDNIKLAPESKSYQQSRETRSNIGKVSFITPFNLWSQESTSSPTVTVLPAETKAGISEKKGLWQLFDICPSDPFSEDE